MLKNAKVGETTYRIEVVPIVDKLDPNCLGKTFHFEKLILIKKGLSKKQKLLTLSHELVHCILKDMTVIEEFNMNIIDKIDFLNDKCEVFVEEFSKDMMQIFKQLKNEIEL